MWEDRGASVKYPLLRLIEVWNVLNMSVLCACVRACVRACVACGHVCVRVCID